MMIASFGCSGDFPADERYQPRELQPLLAGVVEECQSIERPTIPACALSRREKETIESFCF